MGRIPKKITGAELEIMQVLWASGSGTIREVVDRLYAEPTRNNYQTTKKLISRLEAKKMVRRQKAGSVYSYRPLIQQSDVIEERLHDVANSLCDGSTLPLLTCLLQGKGLSASERKKLHQLFDELTGKSGKGARS